MTQLRVVALLSVLVCLEGNPLNAVTYVVISRVVLFDPIGQCVSPMLHFNLDTTTYVLASSRVRCLLILVCMPSILHYGATAAKTARVYIHPGSAHAHRKVSKEENVLPMSCKMHLLSSADGLRNVSVRASPAHSIIASDSEQVRLLHWSSRSRRADLILTLLPFEFLFSQQTEIRPALDGWCFCGP